MTVSLYTVCSSGSIMVVSLAARPHPLLLFIVWRPRAVRMPQNNSQPFRGHTHKTSFLLYCLSPLAFILETHLSPKALSVCLSLSLSLSLSICLPPPRTVWPSDLCIVGCCSVEESVVRERGGKNSVLERRRGASIE